MVFEYESVKFSFWFWDGFWDGFLRKSHFLQSHQQKACHMPFEYKNDDFWVWFQDSFGKFFRGA